MQALEDRDLEGGEEEELDSELLVRETFKYLFPDSFDGVLPIRKHKVSRAHWMSVPHPLF